MWNKIRAFFKDSETIAWARLQAALGFVVAVGAGMDWSPLVGLVSAGGFSKAQIIGLAITLAAQGAFTEIFRRLRSDL